MPGFHGVSFKGFAHLALTPFANPRELLPPFHGAPWDWLLALFGVFQPFRSLETEALLLSLVFAPFFGWLVVGWCSSSVSPLQWALGWVLLGCRIFGPGVSGFPCSSSCCTPPKLPKQCPRAVILIRSLVPVVIIPEVDLLRLPRVVLFPAVSCHWEWVVVFG